MTKNTLHVQGDLTDYSPEEQWQVHAVLNSLFLNKVPSHQKKLILTGGFPGAGKSRFGHLYHQSHPEFVLVDVNDNCLWLIPGYRADYQEKGVEAAYEKWRVAADWISQQAIQKALNEGFNLVLVGTATSPHIVSLAEKAKMSGYTIEFYGFAAPLNICLERSKPENRFGYLSETSDISFGLPVHHITDKREPFIARLGTLMTLANNAFMYWNPSNKKNPSQAFACANGSEKNLKIVNATATAALTRCFGWTQGGDQIANLRNHLWPRNNSSNNPGKDQTKNQI